MVARHPVRRTLCKIAYAIMAFLPALWRFVCAKHGPAIYCPVSHEQNCQVGDLLRGPWWLRYRVIEVIRKPVAREPLTNDWCWAAHCEELFPWEPL